MSYKRILTIQDISCVGQCSLTVALPILSACGLETAILPSAVLSTHTGGFKGFTFRDLTDDMPGIAEHWAKENIFFDGLYTGYLGSSKQIDIVSDIAAKRLNPGAPFIVDPAMADNGVLYTGFDAAFVEAMKRLVSVSDIVLPNITEACFLTGTEYRSEYDSDYVKTLVAKLKASGAKTVVMTGVSYDSESTGVYVNSNGEEYYYRHFKYEKGCHGTGDIYASAFVGALISGKSVNDSARIAAEYTLECIKFTKENLNNHWYGAGFEPVLGKLIEKLS